ncbi:MAG: translation initiation factor IF-2 associated domain-containing protein [Parvularculaceae bacterium]|nr:translation initiation factor IF-2 associated domain-containing protein [Parvularculaceae bacterium]
MSDDVETKTDADGKTGARRPLSLRRTETAAVKQSFSHGRSKTVVVETKKRRVLGAKKDEDEAAPAPVETKAVAAAPERKSVAPPKPQQVNVLRTLSEEEKQARAAALTKARQDEEVRRKRDEVERKDRESREADERSRLDAERQRIADEESRREKEGAERRKVEERARRALEEEEEERKRRAAAKAGGKPAPAVEQKPAAEEADNPLAKLGGRLKTKAQASQRQGRPRRGGQGSPAPPVGTPDNRQRS